MLDKLLKIKEKFLALEQKMADAASNPKAYTQLAREHRHLAGIVKAMDKLQSLDKDIQEYREIIENSEDKDLVEIADQELPELEEKYADLEEEIKLMLLPPDPRDDKNVVVEIRAGTGGEEAGLFAGDLYRMYKRYAERNHWKIENLSSSPSDLGGFKEIIFSLAGDDIYSRMKFESGVHRVQRVPATEASGRIHTSASSVAVLPEADEVEVEIDPNDLRIDVFRSTGPGGQSVNTTDSAVRITHIPSGLVVSCQDEKSQHKNKARALRVLRARLYDLAMKEHDAKEAAMRKKMIGSGERSEKIRTYNFPQSRVTDHRINLTLYRLDQILDGDIDELMEELKLADRTERLANLEMTA